MKNNRIYAIGCIVAVLSFVFCVVVLFYYACHPDFDAFPVWMFGGLAGAEIGVVIMGAAIRRL